MNYSSAGTPVKELLIDFVRESNRIEGILRYPTNVEIVAHEWFLEAAVITVPILEEFVSAVQPGAILRRKIGLNVRVGDHIPPSGGPQIEPCLETILRDAAAQGAYGTHIDYEDLHPFTDGNGRSGRALWLWMMGGISPRPCVSQTSPPDP
ncbi:MAG: Fic family protein [Candidatus Brocadiales bacterium]|nr:Fic family protein [Candidatus Bathyanammoxibius sp.]